VIPPPLQLPAACSPCFESTAPRRLLWARFNGPRITPSIISCVVAELQNPGGQGSKGEVTLFQSSRRRHACRKHDWVRIWGSGLWELQGCGLVSPPARAAVAVTGGCGRVAWYASALSTPNKSQLHSRDAAARLIPLFGCWSPCRASPDSPPRRESAVPTSAKLAAGDCRAHHHYCEQCSHDNVSATHSGSAPSYFPLSHTVILHNADPLGGRMAPLDSPMALVSGGVNPPSGGCGLRIQTMTGTNGSTAV